MSGGERHVLSRSVVSNEFGAAHGNCVYLTNAGDGTSLSPCGHTISHTEIHDCRGLGDPWPSSKSPCDPAHQKREHKPPCSPDPFPNITGNGILINQVVGAKVTNNFIHDGSIHIYFGLVAPIILDDRAGSQLPRDLLASPDPLALPRPKRDPVGEQCHRSESRPGLRRVPGGPSL